MSNPYMCGSAMGMVFCPADYTVNGGTGFSLLFKGWVISSARTYSLACLAVFCLGALRQGLGTLRASLPALAARLQLPPGAANAQGALEQAPSPAHVPMLAAPPAPPAARAPLALLCMDALLLGLVLLLSYLNMLVAMAYDWGLLLSLVAGEAVTYFVCGVAGLGALQGVGVGMTGLPLRPTGEPHCH